MPMVQAMRHILPILAVIASPAFANPDEGILDTGLLAGWATDDGTLMTALSLTLSPGWKTYWRAPGEAGIPPAFDWSASENLGHLAIHWPTPQVFHVSGMMSIGYHDGLVLPLEVTPLDPNLPVVLRGTIEMGVCKNICVPAMINVETVLTAPGKANPAIRAALRNQPVTGDAVGLLAIRCAVDATDDGLRVTASMDFPAIGPDETVVFETGAADVWVSPSVSVRDGGNLTSGAEMIAPSGAPFTLDRSAVRMTIIGEGHAVEITGCPGG
jgi:DsbC/DsbD-like thiol-disulfide interchange protein